MTKNVTIQKTLPSVGNKSIPFCGKMVSGPNVKVFGTNTTSFGRTIDWPWQGSLPFRHFCRSPNELDCVQVLISSSAFIIINNRQKAVVDPIMLIFQLDVSIFSRHSGILRTPTLYSTYGGT